MIHGRVDELAPYITMSHYYSIIYIHEQSYIDVFIPQVQSNLNRSNLTRLDLISPLKPAQLAENKKTYVNPRDFCLTNKNRG